MKTFSIILFFHFFISFSEACLSLNGAAYDILGPFPSSGDHLHGGDSLRAFGEIHDLLKLPDLEFTSELVTGGRLKKQKIFSDENGIVEHNYPDSDFAKLRFALGLGVTQSFRTWAVTHFNITRTAQYFISCGNVHSFFLDGVELVGDPYAISSWWGPNGWIWIPVHLVEGEHSLALRFHWKFQCRLRCGKAQLIYPMEPDSPSIFNPSLAFILPSILNGRLFSPYISIPVTNSYTVATKEWKVKIKRVKNEGKSVKLEETGVEFVKDPLVVPGQIYPLGLKLHLPVFSSCHQIQIKLQFQVEFQDGKNFYFHQSITLDCHLFSSQDSFSFTFLDVDNSVQFSSVRPPSTPCGNLPCSLILALHGSDVDPGSPTWTNALLPQPHSWILMPSNRDKYGYDWQGIGQWSALSCLEAFLKTLPGAPDPMEYRVDPTRLIFVGHSMGGHGCLLFSSHFPDSSLGSLCAAAWIRFDHYVQEFTGIQSSYIDPYLRSILAASVGDYHADLMAVNMKGLPFMARMGANDLNVSPWNLRRFCRLLDEINGVPGFTQLSEIPSKPHWWNGVLNDEETQGFLENLAANEKPSIPEKFTIRAMNLWATGRYNIQILQLWNPFQLAEIKVDLTHTKIWIFQTQNVKRFEIQKDKDNLPSACKIDGEDLPCLAANEGHFCQTLATHRWELCKDQDRWKLQERYKENEGPMRQIFQKPLLIIYGTQLSTDSPVLQHLSTLTANLLMARGHSLVHIKPDSEVKEKDLENNLILMGGIEWNSISRELLPVSTFQKTCEFSNFSFSICLQSYSSPKTGAALLGAVKSGGLVVLVTGTDLEGIQKAVKMLPVAPNSECPDYLVVGEELEWKGAGGVLGAGFWDYRWSCEYALSYPRWPVGGEGETGVDDLTSNLSLQI